MYTKADLINQIKTKTDGILGTNLPMLSKHFNEFAEDIGLDHETFYHIKKYIFGVDYATKRQVFESIGFTVLCMTTSAMKVSRFASDDKDKTSINQEFVDGKRNVFIFEVETGLDNLYFVLEYAVDGDPLADHTIDREEVAREQERKAAGRKWMASIRAKREAREAAGEVESDNPF